MEQQIISLDDILSGKANEQYPDFLSKLINGSITVILTPAESQRIKDIEHAIHALDLADAIDRTTYITETTIEPLTEAGGIFSWLKRLYIGRDASVVDQLHEQLKNSEDEHALQKVIDESDEFLEEARTTLAMFHHPGKVSDEIKDREELNKTLQVGFGKRFVRLIQMYFGSFGLGVFIVPAAFITSAFSSTSAVAKYANNIKTLRDTAQARLDKLKKKSKK